VPPAKPPGALELPEPGPVPEPPDPEPLEAGPLDADVPLEEGAPCVAGLAEPPQFVSWMVTTRIASVQQTWEGKDSWSRATGSP
jgi:hypothetical protein